jgi:hypothetical protein
MDDTDGWVIDSELSIEPMQSLGWSVDMVPWKSEGISWDEYDAVYINTPWDYPDDAGAFIALLEAIDQSSAVLVNDISLVRWTMSKTYLRDLEHRGAAIVPSLWHQTFDRAMLPGLFDAHEADRIIVKPVVSTNAHNTYLLERNVPPDVVKELEEVFSARPFMAQPFMENVQSEGEFSLFFFTNEFSHAILKTPCDTDFRVQEEHGARIEAVSPETELLDTARNLLDLVDPTPVYGRSDFVRSPDGHFLLMEIELIEPSLYLRMDAAAPMRFARAFDAYVARSKGRP